jgi:hypothetical protein
MQTFSSKLYATEADVRRAVGHGSRPQRRNPVQPICSVTFGDILDRYVAEEMPDAQVYPQFLYVHHQESSVASAGKHGRVGHQASSYPFAVPIAQA